MDSSHDCKVYLAFKSSPTKEENASAYLRKPPRTHTKTPGIRPSRFYVLQAVRYHAGLPVD